MLPFSNKVESECLQFYHGLCSEGHAALQSSVAVETRDLREVVQYLSRVAAEQREHLVETPPALDEAALAWAAEQFYRASQFLVYRELGPDLLEQDLSKHPPEVSPVSQYAVDQVFRFLPDLYRIAHAAAPNDVLVNKLRSWGEQWPLSSVGMKGLKISPESDAVKQLMAQRTLRQLYVDRIIAHNDISRVNTAEVEEAIAAALGVQRDLAPELWDLVNPDETACDARPFS